MHDELLGLRNLGKTSAQWLHASGIHTAEDLRRLGSVGAYHEVRRRGFAASRVLLYAIEGALLDVPWQDLPCALKQELDARFDSIGTRNRS
ncbi:TfoX/Sxy family protein [Stutzerimonas azotifigens]|uniref:TfoX/Sxy family protein n=1 Tax=Stutzerimonas azotifigens TaxID=291995 RepID=UPI0003FEF129|nr:TfoX/Sxy family protein [Stutzerimonas azotifigens]